MIEKKTYSCYRSFWPELEATSQFGELGIHTRCFFASNTINSAGFEYCKYPPIWLGIKRYDFSAYDRQVADLLKADPQARFLCTIDLNTPYWLTRKLACDSFDAVSHAASDPRWLEITTEWLGDFIAYSEAKYGDKIEAYILSGGGTSEWYEYDRGRGSRVKNTAWRNWCQKHGFGFGGDVPGESTLPQAAHEDVIYDPATEMDKIQYWRFHNEIIADAVLHFAESARGMVDPAKEIGVFFGYFMVSDSKLVSFGHLDYERVFASPYVDFLISPASYNDRMIGGGSGPQLVHGTAARYGKRYLHEIDHLTHCAPEASGADGSWRTQEDDEAGLKREAVYALVHHASHWWFDMWGGRFPKGPTQLLIGQLQRVWETYAADTSPSVAEVLLVADPQSACYVNEKSPLSSAMARKFREVACRTGAPFDVVSFNDLSAIDLDRYKVVCLPATFLITPERTEILRSHVLCDGRTVVWMYAPGITNGRNLDVTRIEEWTGCPYGTEGPATVEMDGWTSVYAFAYETMNPPALRAVLRQAGVHLYVEDEDPVYANERLLAVHCRTGGPKTVTLPQTCGRVVDILSGATVAENTSSFPYTFKTPDTVLFELI
jgi:hypothetical protein